MPREPDAPTATTTRTSRLAVWGLILALASGLGLWIGLFTFLVPSALALCLWSLLLMRRHAHLRGRTVAWTGLAVSLFLASWIATRSYAFRNLLHQRAHDVAREWLELVQTDQLIEATARLGTVREFRRFRTQDIQMFPERFFSREPLSSLRGSRGTLTYRGILHAYEDPFRCEYTLRFDFLPQNAGASGPVPIVLTVKRLHHHQKGHYFWFVDKVNFAGGEDDSAAL